MTHRGYLSFYRRTAMLVLVTSFATLVLDASPADAGRPLPNLDGTEAAHSTLGRELLAVVCPGQVIRAADLDAVRGVNDRAAIEAAIREAGSPREVDATDATAGGARFEDSLPNESTRWHGPTDPREIAGVLENHYGPGSLVARSASGVAALAGAAEHTAQVPLDRANVVADAIVDAGRRIPGLENIPDFELRSRLMSDEASVTLSTRW